MQEGDRKQKGISTSEAFKLLVSTRNWWRNCNISEVQATNYKSRFKNGTLSASKIESILEKAGGIVVQEKLWSRNFIKQNYMIDRYQEEDFSDFLNVLIGLGGLEKKELGITKLVLSEGYPHLSSKQRYIFDQNVVDPFSVASCEMCGNPVPWSEMYEAYDNGGYCSWCIRHVN